MPLQEVRTGTGQLTLHEDDGTVTLRCELCGDRLCEQSLEDCGLVCAWAVPVVQGWVTVAVGQRDHRAEMPGLVVRRTVAVRPREPGPDLWFSHTSGRARAVGHVTPGRLSWHEVRRLAGEACPFGRRVAP